MREKIEAMIVLLSFATYAAVNLAILPALVAYQYTHDSNVGFWVYVASVPILIVPTAVFCVWLTSYALDRLGNDEGEWITVKSDDGNPRRVKITPKVYKRGGDRDHETEQLIREGRE